MAAAKQVQITVLGDRDFPLYSIRGGIDDTTDIAIRAVLELNPAIEARDVVMAIWEEGARVVASRASRKLLPLRFSTMRVAVKAPKSKANPRPQP